MQILSIKSKNLGENYKIFINKNKNLQLSYLENNMNKSSFAWVLEVRSVFEEEYKKRHEDIWPEMIKMLK